MPEQIIRAEEIAGNLMRPEECMFDQLYEVHVFSRYLALVLSAHTDPTFNARGFDFMARRAIRDVQDPVLGGVTDVPKPDVLKGKYQLVERAIPAIAAAVCPPEFAQKVEQVYAWQNST